VSFTRTLYLTNHSSVVTDAAVEDALPAFQAAVSTDFKKHWNTGATLKFIGQQTPPTGAWWLALLDDSDQAGALGYHETDANDTPDGKVFAKTDLDYGYSLQVTLTHELFELLADPRIARCEQTSATQMYALEVGDPVEADQYAYTRPSATGVPVKISDFITERWFDTSLTTGPFDFAGHLTKPLQLLPGGYVSIFVSGKGWTSKTMRGGELVDVSDDDNRFRESGRFRGR
jgi:hypothetical protein